MDILQRIDTNILLDKVLQHLKQYSIGFICVSELNEHYTGASHRFFINTTNGVLTIFWFDKANKLVCQSKKFKTILMKDKFLGDFL